MRTDYFGHDAMYRRYRSQGAVGWDQTDAAYRERASALDRILGAGFAPKTGRLLELGCGAGNITLWLGARGYDALGVDISPAAIQWANERALAEGSRAGFLVGDVLELTQLEEGAFDLVLDGHCLHCIIGPDRPRFFASAHRLLAAGGYLLVDTMCGPVTDTTVFEGYDPASRCTLHGDLATRYLGEPEELLNEVASGGFRILRSEIVPAEAQSNLIVEAVKRS
jgi:SAM-dependent methyltransferase